MYGFMPSLSHVPSWHAQAQFYVSTDFMAHSIFSSEALNVLPFVWVRGLFLYPYKIVGRFIISHIFNLQVIRVREVNRTNKFSFIIRDSFKFVIYKALNRSLKDELENVEINSLALIQVIVAAFVLWKCASNTNIPLRMTSLWYAIPNRHLAKTKHLIASVILGKYGEIFSNKFE
jgi:hypothetical protein